MRHVYDAAVMFRVFRCISALGAVLFAVWGVAACGGGGGGGGSGVVVARVGGEAITRGALDHWVAVMAGGRVAGGTASAGSVALRRRALSFLISSQWTLGEAGELGVGVSDGEAVKQLEVFRYDRLEGIVYEGLPTRGEVPALLAGGGVGEADRVWLMRLALLGVRVRQKQLAVAGEQVTGAQIAAYYAAHKAELVEPERRDVRWIVTYSALSLSEAIREIRAGKNFIQVAKHASLDPPTIIGMELASAPEKDFARRVFSAKPHVWSGPFLQTRNHYELEVTRIQLARQFSLAKSEASIRRSLADRWVSVDWPPASERKWAGRTSCARGYVVAQCGQVPAKSV